jgi:hypothetical protein
VGKLSEFRLVMREGYFTERRVINNEQKDWIFDVIVHAQLALNIIVSTKACDVLTKMLLECTEI